MSVTVSLTVIIIITAELATIMKIQVIVLNIDYFIQLFVQCGSAAKQDNGVVATATAIYHNQGHIYHWTSLKHDLKRAAIRKRLTYKAFLLIEMHGDVLFL